MNDVPEIMIEINRVSNVKTMSSREIAKLTSKEHKNVIRDIEKILNDAEIDRLKFEHIYLDKYKREQREYLLPYREALLVTSGYDTKQRLKIIDRWVELEVEKRQQIKPQKPVSPNTILRVHKHLESLAKQAGLEENQLLLRVNQGVTKITGVNQLEAMDITYLPSADNDEYLTPTQIGQRLNPVISPREVNRRLLNLGLQISRLSGGYNPTPKGRELGGRLMDVSKNHTEGSTQQLRWHPSIIDLLQNGKNNDDKHNTI